MTNDPKFNSSPPAAASNTQKDPAQWKTGDEPMTGAQRSYLHTLADQAGVEADDSLTKAQASEQIDELRQESVASLGGGAGAGGGGDGGGTSNTQKDPATWKTGDEPMTGAQRSYLQTLSQEAGQEFDQNLNKAQASERIDSLRHSNPRIK